MIVMFGQILRTINKLDPLGLTHQQIEERSILLHRAVAQRISENPVLLEVARGNLHRWIDQGGDRPYWSEWQKILAGPLDEILAFMVSPSEKARRLRQSSPFRGILTPRERWKIYESFAAIHNPRAQGRGSRPGIFLFGPIQTE
jgi:hypothetical protein